MKNFRFDGLFKPAVKPDEASITTASVVRKYVTDMVMQGYSAEEAVALLLIVMMKSRSLELEDSAYVLAGVTTAIERLWANLDE